MVCLLPLSLNLISKCFQIRGRSSLPGYRASIPPFLLPGRNASGNDSPFCSHSLYPSLTSGHLEAIEFAKRSSRRLIIIRQVGLKLDPKGALGHMGWFGEALCPRHCGIHLLVLLRLDENHFVFTFFYYQYYGNCMRFHVLTVLTLSVAFKSSLVVSNPLYIHSKEQAQQSIDLMQPLTFSR